MYKIDNFLFGLVIGAIVPVIFIYFFNYLFLSYFKAEVKEDTIYVLSVLFNFLIFRLYMINMNMDKTGRGILLSTFIHAFIYIYLFFL